MATAAPTATGRVIQITGPGRRHRVPARPAARDLQRGRDPARGRDAARLRGPAAPRQQLGPLGRDDDDRRPRPRHRGPSTPAARSRVPVGEVTLGRVFDVLGNPIDGKGAVDRDEDPADPPLGAGLRPADDRGRGLRDRPQGHRPDLPVQEGRQDRHLRRRRRRQDGHHPGADPERRPGARRRVGVRRRRRAHPRGQRPHPRDDRVGRHREDGLRLRPDERAARAPASGSA